ncbi:TetR/AcrR family transcriptional regulator [Streptomyces boluensis]|uniref:TetR family transcriptional regulator n=1 Tax=Streptomyces boluensis TaxID=1775135 RepID=A0A964XR97_9ACTN|nr:TetR family transcriptional regulator [Streptomyces boluensis]NBE56363.1 TetR family transcriptional regulator [Streptomyces boluensis]
MSGTTDSPRPASAKAPSRSVPAPSGAPRRSDATRAAILAAARERFAADGYERATIRAIARDAGIDPSMVMRYYGNKEGLFAAAAEIDLHLPELSWPEDAEPTVGVEYEHGQQEYAKGERIGAVLVAHFLERWESDEVLTALLRVGVTNASGAERMQEILKQQLVPVAARYCPDPEAVPRRAALAASQILGMALARYVLRFPPAVEMSRDEVIAWLGPTVQRYLTAPQP